jgi:hypothetical protein
MVPTLEDEEEIVWMRHPKYPLVANQVGIIMFDDEYNATGFRDRYKFRRADSEKYGKFITTGAVQRLIWECFHGSVDIYDFVLHINGNIVDNSIENLVRCKRGESVYKNAILAKKKFLENSARYMLSREEILLKRGIEPDYYWKIMDLPKDFYKLVKTYGKKKDQVIELSEKKTYLKGDDRAEMGKRCQELLDSGKRLKEIKAELDIASCALIRKYIKFSATWDDI